MREYGPIDHPFTEWNIRNDFDFLLGTDDFFFPKSTSSFLLYEVEVVAE